MAGRIGGSVFALFGEEFCMTDTFDVVSKVARAVGLWPGFV